MQIFMPISCGNSQTAIKIMYFTVLPRQRTSWQGWPTRGNWQNAESADPAYAANHSFIRLQKAAAHKNESGGLLLLSDAGFGVNRCKCPAYSSKSQQLLGIAAIS